MQQQSILVVDDDADIRTVVRRTLTAQGYRVIEAWDGLTAFRMARQMLPALIVLDLGLPGLDGWGVTRALRADPALEQIPILAITGYGTHAARRAAYAAGCQGVIDKPFALTTLESATAALLTAPPNPHSATTPLDHQDTRHPPGVSKVRQGT